MTLSQASTTKEVSRIAVFREAFRDLIVHVQTFGPLLAQIKQEYEEHLEQEAREKRILQVTDRQKKQLPGLEN